MGGNATPGRRYAPARAILVISLPGEDGVRILFGGMRFAVSHPFRKRLRKGWSTGAVFVNFLSGEWRDEICGFPPFPRKAAERMGHGAILVIFLPGEWRDKICGFPPFPQKAAERMGHGSLMVDN
jgi:hypothetical protein